MLRSSNNPFTPEQPIVEEESFFGREDVIEWIDDCLVAGERFVVVYGMPRIGKTSLLFRLRTRLANRAFPAYVAVGEQRASAIEMLWHLVSTVHTQLGEGREDWPTLLHDAFVAGPDRLHSELLPLWRKALHGRPVALLLDGLVVDRLNEGIWADLVARLREIVDREPDIQVVAVVAGASTETESPVPALRGLPQRDLDGLSEEQTEELLVGLARFQLGFDYDALRRIHTWTGGHPYLLHVFGSELYRRLAPYGQVTIHIVEDLLPTVVEVAAHLFAAAWEEMGREERVTLAAIGSLVGYRGAVAPWDIVVLLRKYGVNRTTEAVDESLKRLCRRRVLHWLGGSGYALYSELWRPWLAEAHPLVEVLTGKRQKREAITPAGRRLSVDWGALLLYAGIGLAILLVAKVWRSRQSPAVVPLPTPTVAVTPRPTPTRVILPGKVAYMAQATVHEPWAIWIMRDNGSDPVQVTEGTSDDTLPAWSPDGARLAFVSNRTGDRDIWVMNADGTHLENITRTPAADEWTPAWSPDGSSIAFASNRDGNWELYIAQADGSGVQRITWHEGPDYSPDWSPDGSQLAFVSERGGNPEICVVNRDGSGLQRLTPDGATALSPRWSPDGTLIAFESYRDGNMEIYTMAPDGSDPRNLTGEPGSDEHGPAWSPDGKWILYYSNRDGSWDIFKMRADGEQKTNLTLGPAIEQAPAWQPEAGP